MIGVKKLDLDEWRPLSEKAHVVVFNEQFGPEFERIDFALLAEKEGKLVSYVTCRELDSKSLYWQYGGTFPTFKGTAVSVAAMHAFRDYCLEKYNRVAFLVQNTNKPMLKLAHHTDFLISGVRMYHGEIFVEHIFEKAK